MSCVQYFFLCLLMVFFLNKVVFAKKEVVDKYISTLTADHFYVDNQKNIFTARGNVIFFQKDYVIYADIISYNKKKHIVIASGKVIFQEPYGDVFFINNMELTGNIKNIFLSKINIISQNNSLLSSFFISANGYECGYKKFSYSICQLWKNSFPTWFIRSTSSFSDKKKLKYIDIIFNISNVSVFYIPFFMEYVLSKNKKKFLIPPTISSLKNVVSILIPSSILCFNKHFLKINLFFSSQLQALEIDYINFFNQGKILLNSKFSPVKHINSYIDNLNRNNTSWNISNKVIFNLNKLCTLIFNLKNIYHISDIKCFPEICVKRIYMIESYIEILSNYFYFKGIGLYIHRYNHKKYKSVNMLISPYLKMSLSNKFISNRIYSDIESHILCFSYQEKLLFNSLSVKGGLYLFDNFYLGNIFNFSIILHTDIYKVRDTTFSSRLNNINTIIGYCFYRLNIYWEYPFYNNFLSLFFSPIFSLTITKNCFSEINDIYQNNKRLFKIDNVNFFISNDSHAIGYVGDVLYGIKFSLFSLGTNKFLIGQNYNIQFSQRNIYHTSLIKGLADFILEFQIGPKPWIQFFFKGIYDNKDLSALFNKGIIELNSTVLQLSVIYSLIKNYRINYRFSEEEKIKIEISSKIYKKWMLRISIIRDLRFGFNTLAQSFGIVYKDNCCGLELLLRKIFYNRKKINSSNVFIFKFSFKDTLNIKCNNSMNFIFV